MNKNRKKYIQNVEFAIQNLIRSVEQEPPYGLMKLRIAQSNGEKCALAATLTQKQTVKDRVVY